MWSQSIWCKLLELTLPWFTHDFRISSEDSPRHGIADAEKKKVCMYKKLQKRPHKGIYKFYLGVKLEAQYFLHEWHKTKNNHTCFADQS